MRLETDEVVLPVVGNTETHVKVEVKLAILCLRARFPTFGIVRITYYIAIVGQGLVNLSVRPRLRLSIGLEAGENLLEDIKQAVK